MKKLEKLDVAELKNVTGGLFGMGLGNGPLRNFWRGGGRIFGGGAGAAGAAGGGGCPGGNCGEQ